MSLLVCDGDGLSDAVSVGVHDTEAVTLPLAVTEAVSVDVVVSEAVTVPVGDSDVEMEMEGVALAVAGTEGDTDTLTLMDKDTEPLKLVLTLTLGVTLQDTGVLDMVGEKLMVGDTVADKDTDSVVVGDTDGVNVDDNEMVLETVRVVLCVFEGVGVPAMELVTELVTVGKGEDDSVVVIEGEADRDPDTDIVPVLVLVYDLDALTLLEDDRETEGVNDVEKDVEDDVDGVTDTEAPLEKDSVMLGVPLAVNVGEGEPEAVDEPVREEEYE